MQSGKIQRPLSYQPGPVKSSTGSKIIRAKSLIIVDTETATAGDKVKLRRSQSKRNESFDKLEELLECGICLSRLENPKMLDCQHTFCYECLNTILTPPTGAELPKLLLIQCPLCQQKCEFDHLDNLRGNMYINNVMEVLKENTDADETDSTSQTSVEMNENTSEASQNCTKCKTMCQEPNMVKCQHCKMNLCAVCFPQHAEELKESFSDFLKQLHEHEMRLEFEQKDYQKHYKRVLVEIQDVIKTKIQELNQLQNDLIAEIESAHESGAMEIEDISGKIQLLKNEIFQETQTKPQNKVMQYMNYHQRISKISDTINQLSSNYKQFNLETLKLDDASLSPSAPNVSGTFIYDEIHSSQVTSPELLLTYYKNKQFIPKSWNQKLQKPTGVCASPWKKQQVYVCNMKMVYVYDISLSKIVFRIAHDDMLCPQSIACNATTNEMFVSDKWKNCIYVFTDQGNYVRKLLAEGLSSPHGIALTKTGDLLICDTGNDRVLIADTTTGKIKHIVGKSEKSHTTELSTPSDVATDGKIIAVADVGNNRIKIFDAETLKRLNVIGSFGKQKGQIRSAEVVHVDDCGFILVGDSGNKRIQIFNSKGNLVKCTSSEYKFNWISGLCTNSDSEVIVTDYRSKILMVF